MYKSFPSNFINVVMLIQHITFAYPVVYAEEILNK